MDTLSLTTERRSMLSLSYKMLDNDASSASDIYYKLFWSMEQFDSIKHRGETQGGMEGGSASKNLPFRRARTAGVAPGIF